MYVDLLRRCCCTIWLPPSRMTSLLSGERGWLRGRFGGIPGVVMLLGPCRSFRETESKYIVNGLGEEKVD